MQTTYYDGRLFNRDGRKCEMEINMNNKKLRKLTQIRET